MAARKIVWADPSLRYTRMLLGRWAANKQTMLNIKADTLFLKVLALDFFNHQLFMLTTKADTLFLKVLALDIFNHQLFMLTNKPHTLFLKVLALVFFNHQLSMLTTKADMLFLKVLALYTTFHVNYQSWHALSQSSCTLHFSQHSFPYNLLQFSLFLDSEGLENFNKKHQQKQDIYS